MQGIQVEQIIGKPKEAEVVLSKGRTIKGVSLELVVTDRTDYRWRKEYGGPKISQARRLKELERTFCTDFCYEAGPSDSMAWDEPGDNGLFVECLTQCGKGAHPH